MHEHDFHDQSPNGVCLNGAALTEGDAAAEDQPEAWTAQPPTGGT